VDTRRLSELSLLTAFALIIFIIEIYIPNPVPIPGVKLGLANIITVYAVYHYKGRETALILYTRILLGSVITGNFTAFFYSLTGGTLCLIGMLLLRRVITEKHIWVSSILGAVLHNTGQIAVAVILTGTFSVMAYLPFLLVTGCIAGLFTGLCARQIGYALSKLNEKSKNGTRR
jgi:heptaprenyl diphosphate synthase